MCVRVRQVWHLSLFALAAIFIPLTFAGTVSPGPVPIPGTPLKWVRALRTRTAWCRYPRVPWRLPGTKATMPGQRQTDVYPISKEKSQFIKHSFKKHCYCLHFNKWTSVSKGILCHTRKLKIIPPCLKIWHFIISIQELNYCLWCRSKSKAIINLPKTYNAHKG